MVVAALIGLPFGHAAERGAGTATLLLAVVQPLLILALLAYLVGFSLKPALWGLRARAAARDGRLYLVYQPKTAVGVGGELRGFEALVRWGGRRPRPPDQWVPYVERGFWMRAFNLWVLEHAMAQARAWRDAGVATEVSVNLSPQLLADPDVPEIVLRLLARWDLPPQAISLEITERALVEGTCAPESVERLALAGVGLYLDDFGIGYSSLRRLVTLPLSGLKVDRSFVLELEENERAAAAVESAAQLGKALGLTVTAEGVETVEAWHRVRLLGVDVAQGYLIARPMPAAEVPGWIEDTGGVYLPDRRGGIDRREDHMTREAVLTAFGRDRRHGVERRHSARDALRARDRESKLLVTDDLPALSPQAP